MNTLRLFISPLLLLLALNSSASDKAASEIEKVNQELENALKAASAARLTAIYTQDAKLLPPNSPMVSGLDNIHQFWQGAIDAGVGGAELETLELEISGDKATEIGSFVIQNAQGEALNKGKYLILWKKENNQWKYHRDIWNSSQPAK